MQIAQIVSNYIKNLRPSGENLRGECPFHTSASSKRSFYIHVRNGAWRCFSCGESGTLARLLYRFGLNREQVAEKLQDFRWTPQDDFDQRRADLSKVWHVLPEWVLAAYDSCPVSLLKVGFTEETLRENDVGYDELQDRITFPIRDYLGRLVAVSGRAYEDGVIPRYKVYQAEFDPVVPGYIPNNRDHLYGFHEVYPDRFFAPRGLNRPLIIVEGYKGRLWLSQLDFKDVVALQGSSLTRQQERWLGRVEGPFYVMLDHEPGKAFYDKEGRCAALTVTRRLAHIGRSYICSYPEGTREGTSPDDLDKQTVEQMLAKAESVGQFTSRNPPRTRHASFPRRPLPQGPAAVQ